MVEKYLAHSLRPVNCSIALSKFINVRRKLTSGEPRSCRHLYDSCLSPGWEHRRRVSCDLPSRTGQREGSAWQTLRCGKERGHQRISPHFTLRSRRLQEANALSSYSEPCTFQGTPRLLCGTVLPFISTLSSNSTNAVGLMV